MEHQHKLQPFSQYQLAKYHSLLRSLPPVDDKDRVRALVEGTIMRCHLKLYKGTKAFVQDLQTILDHDRDLAPTILKQHKILVSKDGSTVLTQCIDCGKFMPPFKFCNKCQHVHYCSQACEMRSKFTHQATCKPRQLPSIDAALQVEVHVGGDLGREVEVYFQHQMRMSVKIRGEQFISGLFEFFNGEGKPHLPQDCRPEIINGHLKMRLTSESTHATSSGQALVPQSMDLVSEVYCRNPVLGFLVTQLLRKGGILTHLIRQVHNNHLHLIYIFLCS